MEADTEFHRGPGCHVFCDDCGMVANADVNGAENIRQKVPLGSPKGSVNRSNGWLAQPSAFLFDKETGAFVPQEPVTS